MGYYTHYKLEWKPRDGEERTKPQCPHQAIPEDAAFCHVCGEAIRTITLSEAIEDKINADEYLSYALVDGENCKWYDHDEDMRLFSAQFPAYLFTLSGEGEDAGDLWVKYYLDGKCQEARAQITFAPFDPEKLK